MLAYVLDKEIGGEKILSDIQKLIMKFRKDNPNTTPTLTIKINSITRDDTSLIPKLEHKTLEPDCIT